jgi:dynein heavy chain
MLIYCRNKFVYDYWDAARGLMWDVKSLMQNLENFDKENVPGTALDRVKSKYLSDPDFQPAVIRSASIACEVLKFNHLSFVFGILSYLFV